MNMSRGLLFCLIALCCQSVYAQQGRPLPYQPGAPTTGPIRPADPEAEQRAEQERQDKERKMQQAQNAIARQTISAVGVDDRDCLQQANARAIGISSDVLNSCNQQAQGMLPCFIVAQHIVQYPSMITSVRGDYQYDQIKSNESVCRSTAISQAEFSAQAACQSTYGVSCNVTSRGVVTSYRTYTQRRYILFGPKDNHSVCQANAAAAPIAMYKVQCSMEIIAATHR